MMGTDTPNPWIDDDGVPWCNARCSHHMCTTDGEATWCRSYCALDPRFPYPGVCHIAAKAMAAELRAAKETLHA